jgi:hypothetical protein
VTIEAGRKRVIRSLRRNWSDWEILIKNHHEGYITWAEFERHQRLIADNANGMSYLGRGSVRRGGALLPGLFRCARCGRKLQVSYGGGKTFSQRYACRGAFSERAEMSYISFGGMRVDRAVAREVLDRVQPFGIEAALAAMESLGREQLDKLKQLEMRLNRLASRLHGRAVNMTRWTPKIGLLLLSGATLERKARGSACFGRAAQPNPRGTSAINPRCRSRTVAGSWRRTITSVE